MDQDRDEKQDNSKQKITSLRIVMSAQASRTASCIHSSLNSSPKRHKSTKSYKKLAPLVVCYVPAVSKIGDTNKAVESKKLKRA